MMMMTRKMRRSSSKRRTPADGPRTPLITASEKRKSNMQCNSKLARACALCLYTHTQSMHNKPILR